jgi:hypothetical protein
MPTILKRGLSIIRGVEPKSTKGTKLKAKISKNVGKINKKDFEREEIGEELLKLEEKGGDSEKIKKAKEDLEKIRSERQKYPKEVGEAKAGEIFTKETEYASGGRVKKAKGGLIKGLPKLAKRGWK